MFHPVLKNYCKDWDKVIIYKSLFLYYFISNFVWLYFLVYSIKLVSILKKFFFKASFYFFSPTPFIFLLSFGLFASFSIFKLSA